MIHECYAEVTCDKCQTSVYIQLDFVYPDYTGENGYHDSEDSSIEKKLINEHEWIMKDGKHFCSYDCANPDLVKGPPDAQSP